MEISKGFLVGIQIRKVWFLLITAILTKKNTVNNTGTGKSHLYNCINSVYIVDDHSDFKNNLRTCC